MKEGSEPSTATSILLIDNNHMIGFSKGSSYPINVEVVVSINDKPLENPMKVLFEPKTT